MTRHDDLVRLRHMLDFARKAVAHCQGRTRSDLDNDELLALALARLRELIGEATKSVSAEKRAQITDIPWREITGTRDRLIHAYPDVNLDIVWNTVIEDLPPLIAALEKAIPAEDD